MTTKDKKVSEQDLDKRVRDRHLASGHLELKTIERHLAELPDLEGHAETLPFAQPALGIDEDDGLGE